MKFNITKEEEKNLLQIWSEVLKSFPEDEAEKDMWISIDQYVSGNGLPETSKHEALTGDKLDEYLNSGIDFEDCLAILDI